MAGRAIFASLKNAIEHAFVTCRKKEIGIFDLPLEIRHVELRAPSLPQDPIISPLPNDAHLPPELTKERLEAALELHRGNRGKNSRGSRHRPEHLMAIHETVGHGKKH